VPPPPLRRPVQQSHGGPPRDTVGRPTHPAPWGTALRGTPPRCPCATGAAAAASVEVAGAAPISAASGVQTGRSAAAGPRAPARATVCGQGKRARPAGVAASTADGRASPTVHAGGLMATWHRGDVNADDFIQGELPVSVRWRGGWDRLPLRRASSTRILCLPTSNELPERARCWKCVPLSLLFLRRPLPCTPPSRPFKSWGSSRV